MPAIAVEPSLPHDRPDPDLEQSIGVAIRAHRIASGMSATALAERAGLSQPYVSQLESGKASPSINTLYRIANALNVTPQQLLPSGGDGLVVIRAGSTAARPIEDRADAALARVLIGGPDTMLQIQDVTVSPTQDLGGFFEHDGEEFLFLLDGTISVELQGRPSVGLEPGDGVWYRARIPHRWVRLGRGTARILVVSAAGTRAAVHV